MAKFLLFVYKKYEERGGMSDLVGSYGSLAEAQAAFVPDMFELAGAPYSSQFAEVWQIENSEITPVEAWGQYEDGGMQRPFAWTPRCFEWAPRCFEWAKLVIV